MDSQQTRHHTSSSIRCILLVAAVALLNRSGIAQTDNSQPQQPGPQGTSKSTSQLPVAPSPQLPFGGAEHQLDREQHSVVTVAKLPRNILRDGGHIAIAPLYIRTADLKWLIPVAGASIAAFATDTHTMTQVVSSNPSFNNANANVSDALRDGFIAAPIALFGVGKLRHNERATESGLLGSEALIDALVVDEVVKLSTFRERPLVDNGRGNFYIGNSGVDSSFVSGHSMISWASAAVIAGEYHSKWAQVGVYSAATGVSLTRVLGQQHFPTDVLIGAAGGWLIGHYVYRAHHHKEIAQATH
ncbi:MAG TPA: phosphatase PAP2 family protein [Acidobacteriaceae bacterium]